MDCHGEGSERLSAPVTDRDGTAVVDIRNYTPFLINVVSNAWQRQTSAIYRERYGLGISDWRVMSMLNIEPGITANRVCEVVVMDKAAVSRALKTLYAHGCLRYRAPPTDPRKRQWWLSDKGLRIHDDILAIALNCEAEMLADVPPRDLEVCLRVLRRMRENLGMRPGP
ncbi:MAG: MarR family winged helix-turn-helix transcriptional regulator [Qingshengfaniella sp.]